MNRCSRADVLAVLRGERVGRLPVFSGLPSLTVGGLRVAGVRYADVHRDSGQMARAAASTYAQYGFECAVVPFDLCVEAEALGCVVDFHDELDGFLPPVVSQPLIADGLALIANRTAHLAVDSGRVSLVAAAIRQLKQGVGCEVAIGAWVPGPFTLAWQIFGAEAWLSHVGATLAVVPRVEQATGQGQALPLLESLADFLARVAGIYHDAGADYLTVHEMGGSPQVIGPATFRALVQPTLKRLFAQLPSPNVLSICGDTNAIIADMAVCGADALSVDQRNDLARSRRVLGDKIVLLGNLDPWELSQGTPSEIPRRVAAIGEAGANAIWPGCDLMPDIPDANMRALMAHKG